MSALPSLEQFKRPRCEPSEKDKHPSGSCVASPSKGVSFAGEDFRRRVLDALSRMKLEATDQLNFAKSPKDVTTKINVSSVLKRAKASPLSIYSPLHKSLLKMVTQEKDRQKKVLHEKFSPRCKRKKVIGPSKKEAKIAKDSQAELLRQRASKELSEFLLASVKCKAS